jgi:pyridoxal 5'-phosphate synthase pdxT subunit
MFNVVRPGGMVGYGCHDSGRAPVEMSRFGVSAATPWRGGWLFAGDAAGLAADRPPRAGRARGCAACGSSGDGVASPDCSACRRLVRGGTTAILLPCPRNGAAYPDAVPGNGPVVGVLALQGDVREHQRAINECGLRSILVRRPAELAEVDALILPGGESTTISRLLVAFDLMEPLRARLAKGMPAYGACAGLILLSREILDGTADQLTLAGLDVVVRRNAFGRQVDSFEADLEFEGVTGGTVRAVFIRAPWVEQAGADVEVLARVPEVPAAGGTAGRIVAIRQGCVLATAFHPELTGDRRVHQLFCEMVRRSRVGACR